MKSCAICGKKDEAVLELHNCHDGQFHRECLQNKFLKDKHFPDEIRCPKCPNLLDESERVKFGLVNSAFAYISLEDRAFTNQISQNKIVLPETLIRALEISICCKDAKPMEALANINLQLINMNPELSQRLLECLVRLKRFKITRKLLKNGAHIMSHADLLLAACNSGAPSDLIDIIINAIDSSDKHAIESCILAAFKANAVKPTLNLLEKYGFPERYSLFNLAVNILRNYHFELDEIFSTILPKLQEKGLDVSLHNESLLFEAFRNKKNLSVVHLLLMCGADPYLARLLADLNGLADLAEELEVVYSCDHDDYFDRGTLYIVQLQKEGLLDSYFKTPFLARINGPKAIMDLINNRQRSLAGELIKHQCNLPSFDAYGLLILACENFLYDFKPVYDLLISSGLRLAPGKLQYAIGYCKKKSYNNALKYLTDPKESLKLSQ